MTSEEWLKRFERLLKNDCKEMVTLSEHAKKAIDMNYKWIIVDELLYRVRKDHYADLISTLNCKQIDCNCINEILIFIKDSYKPYTKPYHNFKTKI